jgi:rod shape determining protein RodA
MNRQAQISKGIDWSMVWIYLLLVTIGLISIFAVQYRETDDIANVILKGSKEYGKQVRWLVICIVLATFILLTDSKFFTATANLQYGFGIVMLLLVFPFHANVKGTQSIIRFGGFQLQPAEMCKIFTLLALAKFISKPETDFTKPKNHLIAAAISLLPAIMSIAQHETGLALVYFAFFLAMYREGLPVSYLIIGFTSAALIVATLLIEKNLLAIILVGIAAITIYFLRRKIKKKKGLLIQIITIALICILVQFIAVPYIFKNVLKHHQTERIYSTLGIDNPYAEKITENEPTKIKSSNKDSYNVRQSKIAIGSGGFWGKGFLKNTQTRFDFVPEQQTDFIFCSIAEGFGFVGSLILLIIYFTLLWRIIVIAERQRSTFSRVYAYGVASIIFFHIFVNLSMTLGLAPVIGIPLPYISYGGTSLITFTVLLFILIRLDADRQMVLR